MFIRYRGKLYWSHGFKTATCDWNNDKDIYTDITAKCFALGGDCILISRHEKFETVSENEAMAEAWKTIEGCFPINDNTFRDPTYDGEEHYPFKSSGWIVSDLNKRKAMIEKEFRSATGKWNI